MVDAWLLILTIVGTFAIILANIYLFYLYSHPADNKDLITWIGRVIVISGGFFTASLVMTLPLDIANSRGHGGGMRVDVIYKMLLVIHFLYIVLIIPLVMFLYETDEEKTFLQRCMRALCQEITLAIVVMVLTFIAFGAM